MAKVDNDDLAARMRRAMAEYKTAALVFKEQGNEEGFKRYRQSWCVLEAFLPVEPNEYW